MPLGTKNVWEGGPRTIKTRFNERASESPQHRSRFGRQVVMARYLVLLLALLLILALGEIDHSPGFLAQRLLTMKDEWLGRGGRIGRNRVPRTMLGCPSRCPRSLLGV